MVVPNLHLDRCQRSSVVRLLIIRAAGRGVEASAPMVADGDWRRRRKQTPNKQSSLAMAIALEGWTAI